MYKQYIELNSQLFLAQKYVQKYGLLTNASKHDRFCPYCWARERDCYCHLITPVTQIAPKVVKKYRWIVIYHVKEYSRTTNTAKLLLNCLQGTQMYVSSIAAQEKELAEKWLNKKNTVILFPSQDAKSVSKYLVNNN